MGFLSKLFGTNSRGAQLAHADARSAEQSTEFTPALSILLTGAVPLRLRMASMLKSNGLSKTLGDLDAHVIQQAYTSAGLYTPRIIDPSLEHLSSEELCLRFLYGRAVEDPDAEVRAALIEFLLRFHYDWIKNAAADIIKRGNVGFALYGIRGGDLQRQRVIQQNIKHLSEAFIAYPRPNASAVYAEGGEGTSPMMNILTTQRTNSLECIRILSAAESKVDILAAFSSAASLLSQTGDPFVDSLRKVAVQGSVLSLEQLTDLKEHCIANCRAFLSSTDSAV